MEKLSKALLVVGVGCVVFGAKKFLLGKKANDSEEIQEEVMEETTEDDAETTYVQLSCLKGCEKESK